MSMVLLNNIEMFRNSLQYACLKAVSTCDQNKLLLNNFINLNLNQAIKVAFATIMLDIMGVNCQDIHKLQPVAFLVPCPGDYRCRQKPQPAKRKSTVKK